MLRRLFVPVLVLLGLIAVSCGSSSPDVAETVPTAEPSERTTAPEPDPTPIPEPEPGAEPEPEEEPEPEPEPYDAPGGLEVPQPLSAGAPGAIIDSEPITVAGGTGQRILYHSTSADGEDIAVSGFVAYPTGDVPEGGWPLIAWAHGTTGLGDSCAPSANAENDQLAAALVNFGFAVVATDYEGLGTPGVHPYVVGASEAHGVLDSVRAVFELDLPVTSDFVVFGHSQGGHAAMFTGQLHPSYAPELDMIGVVAGAPPSQMSELNDALIGSDFQGYIVMTAAGLVAANDNLSLSDVLSEEALGLLDVIETGCTGEIFDVFNPLDYNDVTIVDDPFALPAWAEAVEENDTNRLPVIAPLLIIHGGEDEQIPVETSATLFEQLCAFADQGPTVRNVYEGQSHAGVLTSFAAVPDLLGWVEGRFGGEPAPNDCG